MLKKIEDLNYYELLEIDHTATVQDIHKAYERCRKIYEPNATALYSLLTPQETETIRRRLDEAYHTLAYDETRREYDRLLRARNELPPLPEPPRPAPRPIFTPPQPARQADMSPQYCGQPSAESTAAASVPPGAQPPLQPPPPTITEFSGGVLKVLREQKGLSLQQIADTTKVGARHLQHIEEETWAKLPARPYLRGFLTLFAKALGFEPDRIVEDYLRRMAAATSSPKK